jgi:hypothetical protein
VWTSSIVALATMDGRFYGYGIGCLQRLLRNELVVFENLKRLVVFGALLIVINSCVLNFECNKVPS